MRKTTMLLCLLTSMWLFPGCQRGTHTAHNPPHLTMNMDSLILPAETRFFTVNRINGRLYIFAITPIGTEIRDINNKIVAGLYGINLFLLCISHMTTMSLPPTEKNNKFLVALLSNGKLGYDFYLLRFKNNGEIRIKKLDFDSTDNEFLPSNKLISKITITDTLATFVVVNKVTKSKKLYFVLASEEKLKSYTADFAGNLYGVYTIDPQTILVVARANLNGFLAKKSGFSDITSGIYIYRFVGDSVYLVNRYTAPFMDYSLCRVILKDSIIYTYTSTYPPYAPYSASRFSILSYPNLNEIKHVDLDFAGKMGNNIMHSRKGDVIPVMDISSNIIYFISLDSLKIIDRKSIQDTLTPALQFGSWKTSPFKTSIIAMDVDKDGYDELVLVQGKVTYSLDPRYGFLEDNSGNRLGQTTLYVIDDDLQHELGKKLFTTELSVAYYTKNKMFLKRTGVYGINQNVLIFLKFSNRGKSGG